MTNRQPHRDRDRGLRHGMRSTKCQLVAASLCVMVSMWLWGGRGEVSEKLG